MKYTLKKYACIIMAFILCFSIVAVYNPSYGNAKGFEVNNSIEEIKTSEKLSESINPDEIDNAIFFFENIGISLGDFKVTDNGLIKSKVEEGAPNTEIIFTKITDNCLSVDILEDDKRDTMTFKDDGTCILNGKYVSVTVTDANGDTIDNKNIQLDGYYWMSNCPVYSASYYTYTKDSYLRTYNIELGTLLTAATIVAVTAAASYALAVAGVPVASALVEEIGSSAYQHILDTATTADGTVLKMKVKYYYHTEKRTFMVTASQGCEKERIGHYGARGTRLGDYKYVYKYYLQSGA